MAPADVEMLSLISVPMKSLQPALSAICASFGPSFTHDAWTFGIQLFSMIREMGRIPAERNTLYGIVRAFGPDEDDHYDPLDLAAEGDERFGSFERLTHAPEFRFADRYKRGETVPLAGG